MNVPAKRTQTAEQLLCDSGFVQQLGVALPKHMTPDRMARIALTQLRKNPKLAQCTAASLGACVLQAAAMGLEPDGRRAHLIPRDNRKAGVTECTLLIDYKGLVELAIRNGDLASIHADVVCENDDFEYNLGQIEKHRIDLRKPRGAVYAVYCLVKRKDGGTQSVVLTRDEVEAVRSRAQSRNDGPWVTDWNEMAKKTAFRRLSKWLVLSPEIRDAVEYGDDDYEQPERVVVRGRGMASLAEAIGTPAITVEAEPVAAPEEEIDESDAVDQACHMISECQTATQVATTLQGLGLPAFTARGRSVVEEAAAKRTKELGASS